MRIKSVFPGRQLGQSGDGRFEVGSVGRKVDLGNVIDVGYTCRPGNLRCIGFVSRQLGIDILGDLWKRVWGVLFPEEVF